MRRRIIKIALGALLFLLFLLGLLGAWTWYQMQVDRSLANGQAQMGDALGGLIIPETAVLYGCLSLFFLVVALVSMRVTYRLVMVSPAAEAPRVSQTGEEG